MRSFVRHVAVACIALGALPQIAAVAQALHVLVEHEHGHGHAPRLDVTPTVLHGHSHSAETDEHDHPATTPTSVSGASHARGAVPLALTVVWSSASSAWDSVDHGVSGDRLATARTAQVLPIVLRI